MSDDAPSTGIIDLAGVLDLALESFPGFFRNVFGEHASSTGIRNEEKR
jgi:hypothetical protein